MKETSANFLNHHIYYEKRSAMESIKSVDFIAFFVCNHLENGQATINSLIDQ